MAQMPPCPYCGGIGYRRPDQNTLICRTCAREFDIREDLCRACGRLNRAESATCVHCGEKLNKKADWAATVIGARAKTREEWRVERLAADLEHKASDQLASQRRMEAYWQEERDRQRLLAARQAEKRARERAILIGILIAVGAIVVIALVLLIVSKLL